MGTLKALNLRRRKLLSQRIAAALVLGAMMPASSAFAAETNEDSTTYLNLQDIITTAERIPTNRWDTPANVTVITAEEIEDNHYQDLAEALSSVNGIYVDMANVVTLNGSLYVVIMVDGQQLNIHPGAATESSADLDFLPSMKMIERIEILKGGGSALYGSNAVGGVVNIITKKGTREETSVDINVGSWKSKKLEITNQGLSDKFGWFITGAVSKRGDLAYADSNLAPRFTTETEYTSKNLSVRLDNRFDDSSSLTLGFMHRYRANYLPADFYRGHVFTDPSSAYENNLYNNVALTYNFKEGTATPGFLRYFINEGKSRGVFDNWELDNDRYLVIENHQEIDRYGRRQGFDYQNGWQLGDTHKLIAGINWFRDELGSDRDIAYNAFYMFDILFDGKVNIKDNYYANNTAGYIQDTWNINKKWTLVSGVRYDKHSNYDGQWSPKLAANYRASDKTKFYASWGRVFKAPGLLAVRYADSQNLKPATGNTVTVGFEHNFDEQKNLSLSYFDTKLNDMVAYRTSAVEGTTMSVTTAQNTDEIQKGFEMVYRQKLSNKFVYDIGYSRYITTEFGGSRTANPNAFRIGLRYHTGPWKAKLLGLFNRGFNNNGSNFNFAPSSYTVLNLNVSYDINDRVTLYTKVNNLTNRDYAYAGESVHSPGRFFLFGVDCKF